MSEDGALLVWMIDDTPSWHEVARRTLADLAAFRLRCVHAGDEARAALAGPGRQPRIVLIDYYLPGERGDALAAELRTRLAGACLVGHSSVPSCSALIVEAGADVAVRKHADAEGTNPSLRRWLAGFPDQGARNR